MPIFILLLALLSGCGAIQHSAYHANMEPEIVYSDTFWEESAVQAGTVDSVVKATLKGVVFRGDVPNGHQLLPMRDFFAANVPAGLQLVVTKSSPTTAELRLMGVATSHADANDVSNVCIDWQEGVADSTAIAGRTHCDFAINFN